MAKVKNIYRKNFRELCDLCGEYWSKKMKTVFYLVRHGTTRANKEDRFAGRTKEPLHPDGETQISALAVKLNQYGIERICCGPLLRTIQSAEILGRCCGGPVQVEEDLTDMNIPHWEGCSKQEIRDRFEGQYPLWLAAPQDLQLPGCEVLADVQKRAVAVLERLWLDYAGAKIVVVSHLIVLRCLVLYYQKRPLAEFRTVKIGNGDVVQLLMAVQGGGRVEEISYL